MISIAGRLITPCSLLEAPHPIIQPRTHTSKAPACAMYSCTFLRTPVASRSLAVSRAAWAASARGSQPTCDAGHAAEVLPSLLSTSAGDPGGSAALTISAISSSKGCGCSCAWPSRASKMRSACSVAHNSVEPAVPPQLLPLRDKAREALLQANQPPFKLLDLPTQARGSLALCPFRHPGLCPCRAGVTHVKVDHLNFRGGDRVIHALGGRRWRSYVSQRPSAARQILLRP